MAAAQERGRWLAYHSDMRRIGPDAQIVAVTHQWGRYWVSAFALAANGTWKSANLWGGVREEMIPSVTSAPASRRLCSRRC